MLVGSQSAHTGSGPDLFISRSLSSKLWREGRWSHGGSEGQTEEVSPAVSEDINRDKTGLGWRCHLLASQDAVTLLPRQIVHLTQTGAGEEDISHGGTSVPTLLTLLMST